MGGFARPGRRVHWREPAELPRGRIFWARRDIPDTSDLQKAWAKHEPAAALLSCYALVQSDNVTPLPPGTKHFLMEHAEENGIGSPSRKRLRCCSPARGPRVRTLLSGQAARRGATTSKEESAR